MKNIFIINPAAGKIGAADELRRALAEIGTEFDWEIYDTTAPKDATEFVKKTCLEHPEEQFRFFACGGDGTLNEVTNGAAGMPNAAVGCYACGSGNDFVKIYGGEEKFRDVRNLLEGEEEPLDLIRIGDKYSINITNFGFDTTVAKTMIAVRRKKIIGGKHSYVTGVVKAILTARRNVCAVEADGEVLNPKGKMLLCTIANGQFVGGAFHCAPKSSAKDGYLDVCLFTPISLFRFLSILKTYTNGKHLDDPDLSDCMQYRRVKSVHVTAPEGFSYSLDGEIVDENDFVAEVAPAAVRFVVPKGCVNIVDVPAEEPAEEAAAEAPAEEPANA